MKTIDISKHMGPVEVFGHKDFCEDSYNKPCCFLLDGCCNLFTTDNFPTELDDRWMSDSTGCGANLYIKLPQCKAAYQKAKQQTEEYCGIMAAKSCEC